MSAMYETISTPLSHEALEKLLAGVDNARIGLIGDLCLDMYWRGGGGQLSRTAV